MELCVQLFHSGSWHDAATLRFPAPQQGAEGPAYLGYQFDYALAWTDRDDHYACSLQTPVALMQEYESPHWFRFLDDIMPAGSARRYWVKQLAIEHLSAKAQDFLLLSQGSIAPVGNLRIKEALPERPPGSQLHLRRFRVEDVVERHSDFLEYAQQMGAISGGATGAGGEAPKLLLRCSEDDNVWIDTYQDDPSCPDAHYLVKFPRGSRSADDCDILRAEYHYYHELAALGVDTIATAGMRLIEGERYPSLWLPRFDVAFTDGQWQRHGLESVYSIMDKAPGSYLKHQDVLRALVRRLGTRQSDFDAAAFTVEWVRRDFLNVAFGNSDNHGRNSALLKKPGRIWLSPVYDFAPMKADPEGVTRTTNWGSPLEEGGNYDWQAIAQALADKVEPETLLCQLSELAKKLLGLKDRLAERGVPKRILEMPAMGFNHLDDKLKNWGLV